MRAVDLGLSRVVNLLLTATVSKVLKVGGTYEHIFVIKRLAEKIIDAHADLATCAQR